MEELKDNHEPQTGKKDHFFGDRIFVLSKNQLELVQNNLLISDLYITDIAFYPHAKNHYRKRKRGIKEHILIYCIGGKGCIKIKDTIHPDPTYAESIKLAVEDAYGEAVELPPKK